ncbi:MAG: DUF3108 domain-containing protein [Bacteroidales bacterium]|nr:DUF3108 domain-containing protein [Bacteroidales bacterium]
MKRFFFSRPAFILFSFAIHAQQSCFEKPSFKAGEVLAYDVYYNWGFIWIHAATVEFKAEQRQFHGKPALYLRAYGASLPSYDWLYKVRDVYECYLDPETYQPLFFSMHAQEGKFEAKNQYRFNLQKKEVYSYTENSDKPYSEDTIKYNDCAFDVLSLIYFSRSLTFSGAKMNDKYPFTALIDNKSHKLFIRYLGKEKAKTRENKTYNCIKFSALLVEGTIFKGGEDMYIWATDDANHVPVIVEAEILVGSVKAVLKSTTGTLAPLNSIQK